VSLGGVSNLNIDGSPALSPPAFRFVPQLHVSLSNGDLLWSPVIVSVVRGKAAVDVALRLNPSKITLSLSRSTFHRSGQLTVGGVYLCDTKMAAVFGIAIYPTHPIGAHAYSSRQFVLAWAPVAFLVRYNLRHRHSLLSCEPLQDNR
jgi:hypothetical protein